MSAGNDRVLARTLVSAMTDDVGQPPEEVLARVLGDTESVRPLPRLVALVVEPPIVMPARVVVGIRRSRMLMLAAALLIATTFMASGIAGAWVERLTAPSKPPDALERLQSLGTVRIAVSPDAAADSFDADIARALAERLGLPVRVVPVAAADLTGSSALWDVALPTAPEWSLDRDDFVVTEPYYAWPRAVLVPTGSGGTSLADVEGQPICAVARRSWRALAHGSVGFPRPEPRVGPAAPERDDPARHRCRLPRRARGRHGAGGCDRGDVACATSRRETDLRSVASLPPEPRAIVVSRDGLDPSTLVAAIEDSLDEMRRDGTLGRYSTTRFGADLTVQP